MENLGRRCDIVVLLEDKAELVYLVYMCCCYLLCWNRYDVNERSMPYHYKFNYLSLSKKGHSTRPSLVTKITSLPAAVSIFSLYKTSFVVVVALFLYCFKLFFKKNTHSNNVKKLKNYTQKFIKIVSENLQTLHAMIYLF